MPEITIPFPYGDLPVKPELTGRVRISEEMQQTLSTLMGWDGSSRRLIKTAQSGVMQSVSPQFGGIDTHTSSGANEVKTYSNIPTTEVMVRGHPGNTGKVWVNIGVTPTASNGWPLGATDSITLSIGNLSKLQVLIVTSGEKVIVIYTK